MLLFRQNRIINTKQLRNINKYHAENWALKIKTIIKFPQQQTPYKPLCYLHTIALLFRPLAEALHDLLLITAITLTSVNYIKRLVGYHWHQQSCVFIMLSYPEIPERFVWKNLDRGIPS